MTAAHSERPPEPNGPCAVQLAADGSRITRLSGHLRSDTGVTATEYPAEGGAVIHLGEWLAESVDVYVQAPELARLIDVLNATYTRLVCLPADRSAVSGAA